MLSVAADEQQNRATSRRKFRVDFRFDIFRGPDHLTRDFDQNIARHDLVAQGSVNIDIDDENAFDKGVEIVTCARVIIQRLQRQTKAEGIFGGVAFGQRIIVVRRHHFIWKTRDHDFKGACLAVAHHLNRDAGANFGFGDDARQCLGIDDGNEAARFARELVRGTQIASGADASYDGIGRGPGFFYLTGVPTAGKTLDELEKALRREVQKVIDEGVTDDELKRIKAQVTASRVYERDSMFFQARQIGSMEVIGFSHKSIDVMTERFKAVTADQVREVAKTYLIDDALTVATLDPQPVGDKKPAAPPAGLRHAQ